MADIQPTTEQWKPAPGWEGFYEVSDHGRVRSIPRTIENRAGRKARRQGKVLRPGKSQYGHCHVVFSYQGDHHRKLVHRLVAEVFIGEIPPGMNVCHNDGDPTNNHVSNLRIDTQSSNILDTIKHGTHPQAAKTHCPKGHPYSGDNLVLSKDGRKRECRQCRRDKGKRAREAAVKLPRRPLKLGGECPKGHAYDDQNTAMSRAGYRYCKTCNRERARAHTKAKREARAA